MLDMNLTTALLNVRQMSEADRLTVVSGIPDYDLMEQAAHAVAQAIQDRKRFV